MQVESIAECSKGSILQYFQPSLSYHLSLGPLFCLFLSDCLRQVFLYTSHWPMSSSLDYKRLISFAFTNCQFTFVELPEICCVKWFLKLIFIINEAKNNEIAKLALGQPSQFDSLTVIILSPPVTTFVIFSSRLLMFLGRLYWSYNTEQSEQGLYCLLSWKNLV